MASSTTLSRWACRLTVKAMCLPEVVGGLFPAPRWVYLHTLTFADPEPAYDEARRRWNSFRTSFLERGARFGVVVPQWGEKTQRLHFHLVTTERFDAKETAAALKRYGFGRYDVRRRPAWKDRTLAEMHPAAWYAARYVARRVGCPVELKGARMWSVFGKKHFKNAPVALRDVRITTNHLTLVRESPMVFADWMVWRFPADNLAFREALRGDARPDGREIMREITKEQNEKVLKLIAAGDVVGVGEYRACGIEVKEMADFKNPAVKHRRVVVSHKVDFGAACERREFDEVLPVGADEKSVTPPAKSGDLVAVAIDGMNAYRGGVNYKGRIFKL